MKRCLITAAALGLAGATWLAPAAAAQALGPEGRAYAVETDDGRYTVQLRRGGRYEDSRGAQGRWNFDGRSVCMLVQPPRGGEYEACAPFRDLSVGQSITTRAWTPDGSQARVTRVE